jgi:hypothetical protein
MGSSLGSKKKKVKQSYPCSGVVEAYWIVRRGGSHIFKTTGKDGGQAVSLTSRPRFYLQKYFLKYSFILKPE